MTHDPSPGSESSTTEAPHAPALDKKFNTDLIWNYAATAVMAASGVALNLVVAGWYGPVGLGVFNQVYAVYVVMSQFATGGLHYSSLKHVAEHVGTVPERTAAAWSAVAMAVILGALVGAIIYLGSPLVGWAMDSESVGKGLSLAAPGLFFFAVNKVLIGVINGMRRMRAFAVVQSLRYVLIIAGVAACALMDLPDYWLGATFTFAEALLVLLAGTLVVIWVRPGRGCISWPWLKRHAAFGIKGFLSPLVIEINARVDVAMLGLFLSDQQVGIYSFAAMVAEGFYNLLVVVRNNVNPMLVQLLKEDRKPEIKAMFKKLAPKVYVGCAGLALVGLLLYQPCLRLILGETEFLQSWSVMLILFAGICVCSGYVPFDFILLQAGQPGQHTLLTSLNLMSNICFNAALIPFLGNHGAALGTALALSLSVLYLNVMVKKRLGFYFGPPVE